MLVSDSARLLFVHVQKTGGSTIDRHLMKVLPDARKLKGVDRHATLGAILEAEPQLAGYWIFGVVRNPWARLLSWYRMVERFAVRPGEAGGSELAQRNAFMRRVAERCPDFESFVMVGLDEFKRVQVPQWRYVTSATRHADLVGRQETLEADLRAVHARFDLPWTPLRSINVDDSRPVDEQGRPQLGGDDVRYREEYSDEMRERVATRFARDLEVFGYQF